MNGPTTKFHVYKAKIFKNNNISFIKCNSSYYILVIFSDLCLTLILFFFFLNNLK